AARQERGSSRITPCSWPAELQARLPRGDHMSERDPVALLKEFDRPVAPRREFADALRTRLVAELLDANGTRAQRTAPPHGRALLPRRRRSVPAGAVALVPGGGAITPVVLSRPSPASALDVIRQARTAFATAPPFEAKVRVDLNPDGSNPNTFVPKGATE